MSARTVLAADVGGTHTRVMLAEVDNQQVVAVQERHYESAAFPSLTPILRDFLASISGTPTRACLAIAGPISGALCQEQAEVTNLPWSLDSRRLAAELGIGRLALINDFAAVAQALPALTDDDCIIMQTGTPRTDAPRAVLGAGTGLGQALLIPHGDDYKVIATEGGHVDFAAQSDQQWQLLRTLQTHYGHVSYERLLSGAGLVFIYRFLHERRMPAAPTLLDELTAADDPAAAVSAAALQQTDPLAVEALALFVSIYGAQAGNLALNCLAYGGLYIAGGIAPKIREKLLDGTFMQAFNAKGRMAHLTGQIPVRLIVHPRPGLLGAARCAAHL